MTGIKVLGPDGVPVGVLTEFKPSPDGRAIRAVAKITDGKTIDLMTGPKSGVAGRITQFRDMRPPMKKLSEFKADQEADHLAVQEAKRQACLMLLADVERQNIPLHQPNSDGIRTLIRRGLRESRMTPLGIACDHCGTELVDRKPGAMTASMPPKRTIGCPGCGWTGWLPVR